MANSNGSSNIRNFVYSGKQSLLPPKSPFPIISPSYADYVPSPAIGSRAIQKPREGNPHHHRTSSESFLVEEQPSWLDDLLNEPEAPVRRAGHRRSSSDSFAYMDTTIASNIDCAPQYGYKNRNVVALPSWGSQELGHYRDGQHASLYADPNAVARQNNRAWDFQLNAGTYLSGIPSARDNIMSQSSGLLRAPQNADCTPPTATEKLEQAHSGPNNSKDASEKDDYSSMNPSASETTDTKRAKQQFAQRSRVRKLQYIAELERNVQALQTEGSEVSAELEFLNQQNLILSMENKALKQRLDSMTQEQLIKCMEQEVLEREIGRLRALYQQQIQQPKQQQPLSNHRRSRSRDLDSQFTNLSLKPQEASSSCEPVSGPLRI